MATIASRLDDDIKAAMKAARKDELEVLRMIKSDAKNAAIEAGLERTGISDEVMLRVLRKGIKTRAEAAEVYAGAGRDELAARERFQIEVLERYLPTAASEAEIEAVVDAVIAEVGAGDKKAMGRVIKESLERLGGRADGKTVQRLVAARLS